MGGMCPEDQITTCVYAVYDPGHDSIRWSNAGHLPPAVISADGEVRLLDPGTGRVLATLQSPDGEASGELLFSPDGTRLVSTAAPNRYRVWDLRRIRGRLKEIGLEKLKAMDAPEVLVAVRDGVAKLPGNMLNPEFVKKKSDVVAKIVEGYYTANKIRSGGLQTFGDGVVNEIEARIAELEADVVDPRVRIPVTNAQQVGHALRLHITGHTQRQIATELGISLGAANKRVVEGTNYLVVLQGIEAGIGATA